MTHAAPFLSLSLTRGVRPFAVYLACPLVFAFALLSARADAEDDPPAPVPAGPPPADAPPEVARPPRQAGAPHDVAGPATPPRGDARAATWPAPTDADWAKPCLLRFERTWEDAVAVSQETKKPILLCINMDGEIASEYYAGVAYRTPDRAALYDPYVCVAVSVYRHTPRDHDEAGNRILCPRFGSVTCGEHISIEPFVFETFCDGSRIAPRHIAVNLAGKEVYDVYYANDTASVFEAIRTRVPDTEVEKPVVIRGDRPVVERVASRAREDRQAVEAAYRDGDDAVRKALLDAAAKHPNAAPLDLLRLAIHGLDPANARRAREALARVDGPGATDLIAEALKAPLDAAERDLLVAALDRLATSSTLARWLSVVHRGLDARSDAVDAEAWANGLGGARYPAPSVELGDATLVAYSERKARAAREHPDDPAPRVELAASLLQQAYEAGYVTTRRGNEADRWARALFEEARDTIAEAESLGGTGWRVDAVAALAAYNLGDTSVAYERAEKAMAKIPAGDTTYFSMAVATVFAEGRFKAIKTAALAKEKFPPTWIADLNNAYEILRAHPLGTDTQLVWHIDLLDWLGADRRVDRAISAGLERFPQSDELHKRWRAIAHRRNGATGLEKVARDVVACPGDADAHRWFAGLAEVEAAEQWRRENKSSEALAAYARAVEHFDAALARWPEMQDAVDHRIALIHAARARVALQAGDRGAALDAILASFARRSDSAGTRDGVGITPGETAQMLRVELLAEKRDTDIARLDAALNEIDPELLRFDRP